MRVCSDVRTERPIVLYVNCYARETDVIKTHVRRFRSIIDVHIKFRKDRTLGQEETNTTHEGNEFFILSGVKIWLTPNVEHLKRNKIILNIIRRTIQANYVPLIKSDKWFINDFYIIKIDLFLKREKRERKKKSSPLKYCKTQDVWQSSNNNNVGIKRKKKIKSSDEAWNHR